MSVHQYTTGARTRNVVNIAVPGGATPAYSLTAANSVPSSATDGFKNFNSQRTLHMLVHNNGLDNGGASPVHIAANQIHVYAYNSSLGGTASWSKLRLIERYPAAATTLFPAVVIPDAVNKDTTYRVIVPIEGVERIAVYVEAIGTRDRGTLDIYLGVNSI
jgi:hypothetical protein